MSKNIYPMSTSVKREVYFKMPFDKYFDGNGGVLPGSAEAIKNEDEETRRNYNKLLRVGKLHGIEIRRGGFGSIANYGLVLYLEQHPEKTLSEALDPEIDVEEKRACGERSLNIMAGLPENATPEEADRYIENNEYVKDEEYVANVSSLIQKGVKMFINIDYGKELLYAYEAQGKDIHEVLNDPANLQTAAFFIQNLTTFQQAIYQTFRESGKVRTTACYDDLNIFKKLDTQFKDVNTINIYKDAYTKLDAEGLRSDFIKARGYNFSFFRSSVLYAALCMGNRVAHDPEFEESVSGHTKISNNYIGGKITGLKQLGTLKPEEFRSNDIADVEKSDNELNRSAAVFWEGLRNIADYHKFTEIPDNVWGYTVNENNEAIFNGKSYNVLNMPEEALSDITRQELGDTFFYNTTMARHTLYKDSEELLINAYTPEQRAEIAELVKNDKNLEAFSNSKELAAFTLANAMAGGNANNIFTEKSLMDFDGKSAVDFLKANTMFTVKADGTFDVYNVRDEAAVRNIKQLADSAYNSLGNYTFPAAGADLSGSAYYGFAELARFAENCSTAFKNVDSRLAKTDDPVLKTTRQFAEVMKNLTAGLDPYKVVAAKLAMDKINKEMQGKSMAYITENYPQDFFKQLTDGIEANLKEKVQANLKEGETFTLDDAKNFVADGKYTDKLTRETCEDSLKGRVPDYTARALQNIKRYIMPKIDGTSSITMKYVEKLEFFLGQQLQNDENYKEKCKQTDPKVLNADPENGYLPVNITNEMVAKASDLAITALRGEGETFEIAPEDKSKDKNAGYEYIDPSSLQPPYAAREDHVIVDDKYKKDIAKLNLKKLTGDTLAAGMGFFDSIMRQYPSLNGCMKEGAVSNSYKSCAELFVIDGKPATDYLKESMGKQYNKYSDAEKEWLLKAAIAGAVTDGKHVVEARQYAIDREKDEHWAYIQTSTVRYTRITCDMNESKAKKVAEKFDKKAEKTHEQLLKIDPVKYECERQNITAIQNAEYAKYQSAHKQANLQANRLASMPQPLRHKDAALSDQLRQATSNHSDKKTGDVEKTDETVKQRTRTPFDKNK